MKKNWKNFNVQKFSQNLNPLSLLNTIYQEFKQIQEEQNLVSISDFNKLFTTKFKISLPFIYERLGENIAIILSMNFRILR